MDDYLHQRTVVSIHMVTFVTTLFFYSPLYYTQFLYNVKMYTEFVQNVIQQIFFDQGPVCTGAGSGRERTGDGSVCWRTV